MESPLACLLVLLALPFFIDGQETPVEAILKGGGQFTTVAALLKARELDEIIPMQFESSGEGLTIFAPTDDAFRKLPAGALRFLTSEQKTQLLLLHVLGKYYGAEMLRTAGNPVRTLVSEVTVNITDGDNPVCISTGTEISRVTSVLYDKNPLAIFGVDTVLVSPAIAIIKAARRFTFLFKLLKAVDLLERIIELCEKFKEGVTIFAPTNEAFGELPAGTLKSLTPKELEELLLLHVVPQYSSLAVLATGNIPVRTLAAGLTLNISNSGGEVYVSSGVVGTPVMSAFHDKYPLAVFRIGAVLIPPAAATGNSGALPPASGPSASPSPGRLSPTGPAAAPGPRANYG